MATTFKGVPSAPSTSPSVSVVVPCYNYGRYLSECIASILSQRHVDVDVSIVDDASADGSGDVADALASLDDRVRVKRHARNLGHMQTYNDGLEQVQGKYVVVLSADDILPMGSLARATALLEAHPAVGLCYGYPLDFRGGVPSATRSRVRSWTLWSGSEWIQNRYSTGRNVIWSPEAVVRTEVQRRIGGYDPGLPHAGDLDMWLRVAALADVGRVNGPDQALRRIHGANMSITKYGEALSDLQERHKVFDRFFQRSGDRLPGARTLKLKANRSLAGDALEHACLLMGTGEGQGARDVARLVSSASGLCVITDLRKWKELQWRLDRRQGGLAFLAKSCYDLRRRGSATVSWRRWRRSGV